MSPPEPTLASRSAEFRRVLGAEAVSNFGAMLSRLAVPWLAALALQATPLQMGWLLVADVAAGALGALWLGTLVDRRDKRAVMLATDLLRAAVLVLLAALAATGRLTMGGLMLAAAASGLLTMAFELARSAWTAQRLAETDLADGNARLAAASSLSETAAFALGGWLYQGLGAVAALLIDALSYLGSAALLRGVRPAPALESGPSAAKQASPAITFWREAREGLAALLRDPTLRTLAGVDALVALHFSLAGTSYMIYVSRDLAFDTGPLGLIFATGGLGALAGAALAPRLGRRIGAGPAMACGLAAAGLGTALTLLANGPTGWAAALLVAQQVMGDGGQTLRDVHDRSLRQSAAPPALRARVDAGLRMVFQSATLLGALLGGAVATALGIRWALGLAAGCCLVAAAWVACGIPRLPTPVAGLGAAGD
ncbi:MAG TPA: MFS transporter [Ideonella sp.]|nr:MFS transporter [Ideonella sp.]